MDNYNVNGYFYENYNGMTGKGREPAERMNASHHFHQWGSLFGFITNIEKE